MPFQFSPEKPEVSLLGPGYGECVVIHLGGNVWVIVDSCIDSDTNQVSSLQFLRNIGVDPAATVRQVIATHWHDDHVRGLAATLEACPNAEFVCSAALRGREFLEFQNISRQEA
ncbi:MAG: MBL fold metallo-hydrolase [candidate division WOR-3 bacterium]